MGLRAQGSPPSSADGCSAFLHLLTVSSSRGKPNLNNSEPLPSTHVSKFPFPVQLHHPMLDPRFSIGLLSTDSLFSLCAGVLSCGLVLRLGSVPAEVLV